MSEARELYDMGKRDGMAIGNDLLRSQQEWHDVEIAAAEARGRTQVLALLRDDVAYQNHQMETGEYYGGRHFIADWIETRLAREATAK